MATKNQLVRLKARIGLPVIVTALAGLLLASVASALVWQWERKQSQQEFAAVAQSHFLAVQRGLDEYLGKLNGLRALFEASTDVTREEFERFSSRLLANEKAIQNFSWVPRVTRAERKAHELAGAREIASDYRIKAVTPDNRIVTSPERDEYLPIFYSTVPRTSRIYGVDLLSQSVIQQRLDRARATDALSAVPDFILHSKEGDVHGFLFSLPVYLPGPPDVSAADKQRSFVGFVHGAFITAEAIEQILRDTTTARGVDLALFLADAAPDAMPLHFHSSRLRVTPAKPRPLGALLADQHETGALVTGSARWALVATPIPGGPLSEHHDRAWLVLLAGLLIGGIVVQYMHSSTLHAQRLLKANEEISNLARMDALTSLYNRRAFNEFLAALFVASERNGRTFAVLYFDLDRFKDVNDTLGHPIGDLLLQQAASRVLEVVRQSDIVARFGGDEFAVLQADADDHSAALLAGRINEIIDRPFKIEGNDVHVTASIGIAQYSNQIGSPDDLIMQADLALYRAKAKGGNCFRFHRAEFDREVQERVATVADLRGAVERGEMRLFYQPQVELTTRRIVGVEALVRWDHPTRGLLKPAAFIPVAEQTGVIIELGEWVINEACRHFRTWCDAGISPGLVAVNVSACQFRSGSDLEKFVMASIEKWRVAPSALEVELTESVLMEVTQQHSHSLDQLRMSGVRIAIDDFGTGYSSLNYLTNFPVNRLKIAQELVFGVTIDRRNATVVRTAVGLAADLGIECLAEGIESAEQASFLIEAGCKFGQGYYFSPPVDVEHMTELLKTTILTPAQGKRRLALVAG